MPELPEVETIRRTLLKLIQGRSIVGIDVFYDKIIDHETNDFKTTLIGKRIEAIERVGKYLCLMIPPFALLVHLRMEGRFFIRDVRRSSAHDHVSFALDDGRFLIYHDTRKFGRMTLRTSEHYQDVPPLSKLGPEPKDANWEDIHARLKRRKIAVKTALLDQHVVCGLGNIYVDETLFKSGIHPMKRTDRLTRNDVRTLIESATTVLHDAVELGGTSIRTYTDALGVHGRFQNELKVHTKAGEPCPVCHQIITKQTVGGRGTYVCKSCQKK